MFKKLLFLLAIIITVMPALASAASMGEKLQGKLLLQVEQGGRIWYVAPKDKKRYEVTFANALPLFEKQAVGITNTNLNKIRQANSFSDGNEFGKRFKGTLFLQVEDKGRIWYVDFKGLRHEVTWNNLMELFRGLSLGITNTNLEQIVLGSQEGSLSDNNSVVQNSFYRFVRKYLYDNGKETLTFLPFKSIGYGYSYDDDYVLREYAAQTNCGSETCFDDALKTCTFFKTLSVEHGSFYETFGYNDTGTCNVLVIDNPSNGSHFLNSYSCSLSRNEGFDSAIHTEMNLIDYASCNKNLIEPQRFAYGRSYSYDNGVSNLEYTDQINGYEFQYYPDTLKSIKKYNAENNCGSAECFDNAFTNCKVGTTLAIGDRDVLYYIHGKDVTTGLCTVRISQRTNDNFLETISCKLDNNLIIDQAIDNEFEVNNYANCSAQFTQ